MVDEIARDVDDVVVEPDETVQEAHEYLREDPALGPLVAEHGPLELAPAEDPFSRLIVSVVRQQVSMDAAAAIRERLFEAVTVTPRGVLAADEATLQEAGLSEAKTRYVRNIAEAWQEGEYTRAQFAAMDDDAVRAELKGVTGVGDWTVDMFLMFGLGRPDVFPVGDLGVRKGARALLGEDLSRAELVDHAEDWRPYRSYASLHLWRATD